MGLMDALLLDPAPFEVWVAYRTDGIAGSGTASDPFDGSPKYSVPAVSISGFSRSGLVATATIPSGHGLNNLDVVTIRGVAGAGADRWNGTFIIHDVGATSISYHMTGEPSANPGTPVAAQASKVTEFRFDTVMNSLPERTRVHLGPTPVGLPFLTRGYSDEVSGGWQIKAGVRITGAGADLTSVRLVGSSSSNAQFFAFGHALTAGSPAAPNPLDFFEISDLTIDCNQMIPPGANIAVACGAVRVMGNHAKIRRIKAINWGTNHASRACQVLTVVTGDRAAGLAEMVGCGIGLYRHLRGNFH